MTKIEWTEDSWNPFRASRGLKKGWHCEHVSPGCENCYAEGINRRLGTQMAYKPGYRGDVSLMLDTAVLEKPIKWAKSRRIFVCSMTDLFADFYSDDQIRQVFSVMIACPQHQFQVLTKRAERMREFVREFNDILPLRNVWLGVSVEDQQRADERIPILLETPAAVRFISAEPLLGPIDISPWLAYNPVHEQNIESRGIRLSSGPGGRSDDRLKGADLANTEARLGPMEEKGGVSAMPAREGGAKATKRVSTGASHDRGIPWERPRPPFGLAEPTRATSGRPDDQPSERGEGRQPSGESRTRHPKQKLTTRRPYSQGGSGSEPARDSKSRSEGNKRSSQNNSATPGKRREVGDDSGGLQHSFPNSVEDRPSRTTISWVICGGESGHGARPCAIEWLQSLVSQCRNGATPIFVKQVGSNPIVESYDAPHPGVPMCNHPKGGDPEEWPPQIRIREYPD